MRTNLQKLITLMLILAVSATVFAQGRRPETASFDIIIKGGTVYDGSGGPPRRADVGIKGDRIAAVGKFKSGAFAGDHRCQGPGGSAGLHQHALAL